MEISVSVLRKYLLVFYKCSPFLPFSTIFQVDHLHVVTFVKITIPKAISYSNLTPYICYVKYKKAGLQEGVKFDRDSIESDETVSWPEWRIYQKITINTSKLSLSASNKLGENFRRVCSVLRIGITWNWLYRNFDRLFRFFFFSTSNWGDGGRDFFFSIGFNSDFDRVCSIVDLRVEVHLPLATVLCKYRSTTKSFIRDIEVRVTTDRTIDFNLDKIE